MCACFFLKVGQEKKHPAKVENFIKERFCWKKEGFTFIEISKADGEGTLTGSALERPSSEAWSSKCKGCTLLEDQVSAEKRKKKVHIDDLATFGN